jgi:hypothetical protein
MFTFRGEESQRTRYSPNEFILHNKPPLFCYLMLVLLGEHRVLLGELNISMPQGDMGNIGCISSLSYF